MTDNDDDDIQGVVIINITNTVNFPLGGQAPGNNQADGDAAIGAPGVLGDNAKDAEIEGLLEGIKEGFKSGPQNGAYYNVVNISPDARFFRAGKTDDSRGTVGAIRGALRAGKGGDGNDGDVLRTISRLVGLDPDIAAPASAKPQIPKKPAAANPTKRGRNK